MFVKSHKNIVSRYTIQYLYEAKLLILGVYSQQIGIYNSIGLQCQYAPGGDKIIYKTDVGHTT
jgi:hypothetical protein